MEQVTWLWGKVGFPGTGGKEYRPFPVVEGKTGGFRWVFFWMLFLNCGQVWL